MIIPNILKISQINTLKIKVLDETIVCLSEGGVSGKENMKRFKEVIYGEDYDMFNKKAVNMRSECGQPHDLDFGRKNAAVTYIWLR